MNMNYEWMSDALNVQIFLSTHSKYMLSIIQSVDNDNDDIFGSN